MVDELKDYFAVLRKVGSSTPVTVQYSAANVTDAISEMCAAAGVQNTNGLVEFEILLVREDGKYERAAYKPSKTPTSTSERLAAERAPIVPPENVPEPKSYTEATYHPYTRKAA